MEGVRQWFIKHVVRHLPGGIAAAAGIVPEYDLEIAQTYLLGWISVRTSAGVRFAVKWPIILENENSDGGGGQRVGLHVYCHRRRQNASLSRARSGTDRRDGRASHGVAAGGSNRLSGRCCTGGAVSCDRRIGSIARVERVRCICRQNRDVVVQRVAIGIRGWQVHRTRQCAWQVRGRSCSSRSANAAVANRWYMRSCCRVIDGLISFAALRPRAADRHYWHVTGVKVCAESWRHSSWAVCRLAAARSILLAGRIDVECAVLLDNPFVIGERGLGLCVLHLHDQATAGLEGQRNRGRVADLFLRVDGDIGECRRSGSRCGRCSQGGGERPIRFQVNGRSASGNRLYARRTTGGTRRSRTQWIMVRVGIVRQDTRRSDSQETRNVAGVGIVVGNRFIRERGRRADGCRTCQSDISIGVEGKTRSEEHTSELQSPMYL